MRALILASCLVAAGCSGTEMKIQVMPGADYSAFQTFAWLPGPQSEFGNEFVDSEPVRRRIRSRIESGLLAGGFRMVNTTPDFFVFYAASFEERINIATVNNRYADGPGGLGWDHNNSFGREPVVTGVVEEGFQEGTLILNIVDPATERSLWRGRISSRLSIDVPEADKLAALDDAVDQLIAEFPPEE